MKDDNIRMYCEVPWTDSQLRYKIKSIEKIIKDVQDSDIKKMLRNEIVLINKYLQRK